MRWTLTRILFVVGMVGGGVAGDGCGCNDDGPYIDGDDELQCGECGQYAYRCEVNGEVYAECAPDDPSVTMLGCTWWTEKKECYFGDTAGGTAGEDEGSGDDGVSAGEVDSGVDSSGGEDLCDTWDPDSHVTYNRITHKYEIDQVLVDDLNTNPLPLLDCDTTRSQMVSGGYYEFVHVGRDDLATHLGFVEHDAIHSINGHNLLLPDDYEDALTDLRDDTSFTVTFVRNGSTLTRIYQVVP